MAYGGPVPQARGQQGLRLGLQDPTNYEHFSDAVISCRGGVQIRSHRVVLAALSPMLRLALETDGLKEEDSVLLMPGVEPVEMAEFLRGALRGGADLAPIPDSLLCMGISYQPACNLNKIKQEDEYNFNYDYYRDDPDIMTYEPDVNETANFIGHEDPIEHEKKRSVAGRKEPKKPSEVWQYFRKQGNGETVQCLQCLKEFRFNSGSTSTMFRHLRKAHDYMQETQNTIEIEGVCQWAVTPNKTPRQPNILLTTTKPEPLEVSGDVSLPPELVAPATPSKKIPVQRSNIWKFFEHDKETSLSTCNECKKQFTTSSGTSTMSRHLKTKHKHLYDELEQLNEEDKLERSKREEEKAKEKDTAEESIEVQGETEAREGEDGKENRPKEKTKGEKRQRSSVWKYFQRVKDESACCNQCGKVFSISSGTTTGLIRHLGRVHGDAFDDIAKDIEVRKKQMVEKLTYDWATGSFVPKKKYKAERKERKDKIDESDPATRTCPVEGCGKVYTRRKGMLAHYEAVHSERKPYECNECGKTFARKEGWQRHNHDTARPYLCPTCGKTFRNPRAREVHERSHNDDRRYPCSYCEKRFFTNGQRKVHERIHTGEKPFGCTVCGKLFSAKHQLVTHSHIHTGARPHKCMYCGRAFRHLSTKSKHNCPNKPVGTTIVTVANDDPEEEEQQQQAQWSTLAHEEIIYQQQVQQAVQSIQTIHEVKPAPAKAKKRRRRY